jgi:hypothetical protein
MSSKNDDLRMPGPFSSRTRAAVYLVKLRNEGPIPARQRLPAVAFSRITIPPPHVCPPNALLASASLACNGFSAQEDVLTLDAAMVLPGDCAFDVIPSFPIEPIRAFVAYHHGSSTGWTTATAKKFSNNSGHFEMVYSLGKNSFGNPEKTNYSSCLPNWDAHSAATEDARAKGEEYCDVSW